MKAIQSFLISECYVYWFAFFDAVRGLSQKSIELYNDLIADAAQRCWPEQPVSGEIFESYEFISLLRDKTAARLLPRLSDENLVILTCRCSKSNGIFSMHEKLAEAMQALKSGSCNDEFADDPEREAAELLRIVDALDELERYALCDMLRLLDANNGLTLHELRARVSERGRLVG